MYTVKRVWIDDNEDMSDCVDVLAEMDDGLLWMARFVTIPHLRQEMRQTLECTRSLNNTPVARYTTLDTSHVVVDKVDADTIEDVIDNLLALDVFESIFAPVSTEQIEVMGASMVAHGGA